MEGEVEGMVAVVQGLRDAGLAVTLMSSRRGRRDLNIIGINPPGLAHAKSLVQTSNKAVTAATTVSYIDTAAQICDDRYTSSYQFAHCMARPSSPPVLLAEFPPQRPEPCRTQGNFEIGGLSNSEVHPAIQKDAHPVHSLSNCYTSCDRGSLSKCQSSRGTQDFVHSLRRYPSLSPNRSISSELVQRLIAYTQAKNFSKTSSQSKSMRCLSNKNAEPPKATDTPKEPDPNMKVPKSVQTYTRAKRKKENVPPPVKDKDGRTEGERDQRSPKKFRSRSPLNVARNNRHRAAHINTTYDYLNAASPLATGARAADVRYLTDVTRCLRDTIRQICDDRPVVCPNIQSRYSEHRRQHHSDANGLESSSASNNVGAQASLPMVSTGVSAISSCGAIPGTYQQTHSSVLKVCCRCQKPMPCPCGPSSSSIQVQRFPYSVNERQFTPRNSSMQSNHSRSKDESDNKLEEQVLNWLAEVPVYVNEKAEDKATRENMARQLINDLKALEGSDEFKEKARKEIAKCVSDMPMWMPENKEIQDMFKAQIVDKLTSKLPVKINGDKADITNELADNLANQLHVDLEDQFQKEIWGWLKDIPDFSNASTSSIKENQKAVKSLAQSLQEIHSKGVDESETQEQMQNKINEWLEKNVEDKGLIVLRSKNKLVEKLFEMLIHCANKVPRQKTQESLSTTNNNMIKIIWEWMQDIPDIMEGDKGENQEMVESLAKKLEEFRSRGKNNSEFKHEIFDWLTSLFERKEKDPGVINQNNLVEQLFDRIKIVPVVESDDHVIQNIIDCFREIPEIDMNLEENKNMVGQLAKKIQTLQSQRQEELNEDEIEDELFDWLTKIISNSGANIDTTTKNQIAQKLMNIVTTTHKPRKRWNKLHNSQKLKMSLREEVGHVLDQSGTQHDNQEEMELILTDILADQVLRGEDDNTTKSRLISALSGFNISHEQSEDIANNLIEIGKDMSLSLKTQDSTLMFDDMSRRKSLPSPEHIEMFEESAQKEILNFIEKLTDGKDDKLKEATQELAKKVGDIIYLQSNNLHHSRRKACVEDEIRKYLLNLPLQPDVEIEQHASLLADRLHDLAIQTSTPKRSTFEKEISFRPRRDSAESTISTITHVSDQMHLQAPSSEEHQYTNKLINIIDDWINHLPIDLDKEESMVRDLAGDIVDRQKYLQLNNDAKTSDEEELEHLKYQVFRWLNKLSNVKNLMPSISKADHLMNSIKALSVPQLIKLPERSSLSRDSHVQNMNNDIALLQNEILKWIEAVPEKFYSDSARNKDDHLEMVRTLAEQLNKLHMEEQLTESVFDDVISQWLVKILKEYNEHYFSSLIEGLKGILVSKALITLEMSALMNQNSHVLESQINSVILEWLKEQALYQRRNAIEKREQEQIVAEMSKKLKDALELAHPSQSHRDDMLLNEIKSQIKKFPMDPHLKLNDEFHDTAAFELLEYLKVLQILKQDFEIRSQASGHILNAIEEWTDSLPLEIKKASSANTELEGLKKDFANTLKALLEQHPPPSNFGDQMIKEEIKKYLHDFILEPAKINQKYTSEKVDHLHEKLRQIRSSFDKDEKHSKADNINEIISDWSKNLSNQPRKTHVDQLASEIDDIMANILPNNFDDIRSNIEKLIKTFASNLPCQKNTVKDSHIEELVNKIAEYNKNIANALREHQTAVTEDSVSPKFSVEKTRNFLYDNIERWCENLPIQEGNTLEEKVKTFKQDIARKLTNVIGDLNMKPDIFNDDSLYGDLLNDEIDNLLGSLPLDSNLKNNLPALKQNLIERVMEVKQKTQEELAGHAYKQQLRDAISRNLPSVENLTLEDQAPFEVLKDNVADAYVELHYAADNDEVKSKLKSKISDEIINFCNDYLKRYPESPIDPKKLNRELYGVLQKIPIPKEETIKNQVEQVKIKEEINNLLKELLLMENECALEKLQRKKIVALMAKGLHDIEKEKKMNRSIDVAGLMQKEIKKWVNKLPTQPGHEDNAEQLVEKLINNLKSTEESRRMSISQIKHNTDFVEEEIPRETFYSKFDKPQPDSSRKLSLSQYVPPLPPSTLTTEDREHLQRIRERNQQKQKHFMPGPPSNSKDASVSPIPIDTGSQTELGETQWQTTSAKTTQSFEPSPMNSTKSIQSRSSPHQQMIPQNSKNGQSSIPNQPVSPQVVVKEYYWDSPDNFQGQWIVPGIAPEQQSFPEQTRPCHQPPNQNSFNHSQARRQSGRIPQGPSIPPQQFVSPSDHMGQTMTQQTPYLTPQQSPCGMRIPQTPVLQPQYAPPMSQPGNPSQSFMPSHPHYVTPSAPLQPREPQPPITQGQYQGSILQPSCLPFGLPKQSSHLPRQTPQTPYLPAPMMSPHTMQQPYSANQSSRQIPPYVPQETQKKDQNRETYIPSCESPYVSTTSSPFDTECPEEGPRKSSRPRVTRLGSLSDVPYTKTCGSQSPRPKRSKGSPCEDSDFTIRFPDDTDFWGSPCSRRRVHKTRPRDGPYLKEKERKEEKTRCRCQERVVTKCMGRRPETCTHTGADSMKHCPKCCGVHCPHPSYLFFR